eukprot:TRINITY_DN570_c1_g1_i4.p1 TRINITY_DN570_c1_g1~~TRINITY_DN570_c1_g1_i4.p1  ORF type:complete len:158 (-),score=48.89 TRINITY_DN570_c1_g1_i4:101-574(-)
MQAERAPVRWAQRKDVIFIQVDVADIKNEKVEFNDKKIGFTATGGGQQYTVDIEFYEDVNPEGTKWAVHGKSTNFVIKKKDAAFWPRLTKSKVKHPWLSIDWSRWVDEDDAGSSGFDLGGMSDFGNMGNFPGMGGMGGMGGDEGDGGLDDDENDADE